MITVSQVVEELNAITVIGEVGLSISKIIKSDVHNMDRNALMWVGPKYVDQLSQIENGIVICSTAPDIPQKDCTYIVVDHPRMAFMKVLRAFYLPVQEYSISTLASIHPSVVMGTDVSIGDNVVIEKDVVLGDRVVIEHNTVIKKNTVIGSDCSIGSNTVIGGVGFGYEKDETGNFVMIPHIGNVVLKDHVEIGNNTCIDRAVLGSTTLHEHVKVDNLVHIAHGVEIGKNSLIIANAMVAGSVTIGEDVWVAPSSSIINGKKIGDKAVIGLSAVVIKNVEENQVIIGNPGKPLNRK